MIQIGILDCSPLSDPVIFQKKMKQISADRQTVVDRHRTEKGRRQSLGGGLLLQAMLEQAVREQWAAPYTSFSWKKGAQGKPILRGVTDLRGCPLYVNLSHSGELAAAVLADFEVGIDIQEQQMPPEGVARRFFTQQEQAWIQAAEDGEKADRFFRVWTLKEAYIKTTGLGMRTPLMDFDVTEAAKEGGKVRAVEKELFLCALPEIQQPTEPKRRYALAVGGVKAYETPKPQWFLMEH